MHESSTPALAALDGYRNVTDLLARRIESAPEHAAFEVPVQKATPGTPWRQVTTREFGDDVRRLAKGLIDAGVVEGASVAIMASTSYEWAVADLAIWFAGAVVVPVYETSAPAQVAAIVADAGVVAAFAGDAQRAELLHTAFEAVAVAPLGIWRMDGGAAESGHGIEELGQRGVTVSDTELEARRIAATRDDPATIVYTSGTTGDPKGVVLTHENFLGQVLNIAAAYREVVQPTGNTIIFLPLAHVLARGLQLICLAKGMRIAHLADPVAVVEALGVLRPTFLVVVPRVLQKIQGAAAAKAASAGLGALWRAAKRTAIDWGRRSERNAQSRAPFGLRARHALFDRLFYRRLRAVLGGGLDYVLSGGASLDTELSLFFRGIGVPVIEGYGLTETTAPLTGNLPQDIRSGTVGRPLPGSTVRISDEGEILAHGIGVFSGYRNPAHDRTAFIDGFFRTGDLGRLDEQGRVVLEGRLKDVIVTSTGKTIVPTTWETTVEADALVAHAVMMGEGRPYLTALILLDPREVGALAHDAARSGDGPFVENGQPQLREVHDRDLRSQVQRVVDEANGLVARSEQVRRFVVVTADLDDPLLVTPTLKLKRAVIVERGARLMEQLYEASSQHPPFDR